MKLIKHLYQSVILLIRTRLTRVQYIMIVATLVGLASGLTAVLLKTLVHYLQHWIQDIAISRFAYLLFPMIGLVITLFLVNYFFKGYIEKGIPMVLKAIAGKSSFIPFRHTYQHVATSSITVGLGGSAAAIFARASSVCLSASAL